MHVHTSNLRTLVVDDDPISRAILEDHLAASGHDVFSADDAARAMYMLERTPVHIVIADWIMPGINAILARITRPDLVRDAPWASALPWIGLVWLIFAGTLYWFAGISPIINTLTNPKTDPLTYLNGSGVTFVFVVLVIGIVWYAVQAFRNRQRGVETQLMYQMLPPD